MTQEQEKKILEQLEEKATKLEVEKLRKTIANHEKEISAKADDSEVQNLRDIAQSTKNALASKAASAGVDDSFVPPRASWVSWPG